MDCLRKAYKSGGYTRDGKAHPDNMAQYTNDSGTKGIKSETVKDLRTKWDRNKVYKYYQDLKSSANKTSRKPRADFGMANMRMRCVMESNQCHIISRVGKILHHKYCHIKIQNYRMIIIL